MAGEPDDGARAGGRDALVSLSARGRPAGRAARAGWGHNCADGEEPRRTGAGVAAVASERCAERWFVPPIPVRTECDSDRVDGRSCGLIRRHFRSVKDVLFRLFYDVFELSSIPSKSFLEK